MATRYQRQLDALTERGFKWARAEFSGGNDSGGCEHIEAIRDDMSVEVINWGDPLFSLLSEPVYDRYGSFAGPFDVDGTIRYDVPEGTVVMVEYDERAWSNDYKQL